MTGYVAELAHSFIFLNDGEAGAKFGFALYPQMREAGLCSGDIFSPEGVTCAFTVGSPEADIGAEADGSPVTRVTSGTPLGDTLSKTPFGGLITGIDPVFDPTIQGFTRSDHGSGSDDVNYNYMGYVGIYGQYAYYYAWQYHCTDALVCRASVEGEGTINGQYLASGSDMIFGAAGVGIYCSFECVSETLLNYAIGRDVIDVIMKRGERRYQPIHNESKAYQITIPTCTAQEYPYGESPVYLALKDKGYDLPYDSGVTLRFGTTNQYSYKSTTASILPQTTQGATIPFVSLNSLYPAANREALFLGPVGYDAYGTLQTVGELTAHRWNYYFFQLQTWSFNVIFSALQNADAADLCYAKVYADNVTTPGLPSAYGNQFWGWYGGAASGDYDLPTVALIFGFRGGHKLIQ